jgi:hypothetical protein
MKKHPEDFDTQKIEQAERQCIRFWEEMGKDGAAGKIKNFNPAAWIFNVKNRLRWKDKQEIEHSGEIKGVTVYLPKEKK